MRNLRFAAGAMLALAAGTAQATTVSDPAGDFLPSFAGKTADNLDIRSFSADFDTAAQVFNLSATFAGAVNEGNGTSFVIGVNTGTGTNHPFANIGEANIAFNQAITIQQSDTTNLGSLTANVIGDSFSLIVPLNLLPATVPGLDPREFSFALWTKTPVAPADQNQFGANSQNADFAADNRMITAVPEPTSWALMIIGFGLAGATMRLRRRQQRRGVFA